MIKIAFASLLILAGCAPAAPPVGHPIAVENEIGLLEFPMTKTPDLYSIFNLPGRTLQIKIHGMVLREFKIRHVKVHRPWAAPAVVRTLAKKGMASEPKRTVIEPLKEGDEDTDAVLVERVEDSFEAEDMPDFFTVEFDDKSAILVLPPEEGGILRRLSNAGLRTGFFLKRLIALRPPSATISLSPGDARALYWTLLLNQKVIVSS